ncbi:hypothetical protein BRD17_08375 [Halobacteriales archaeon SW_7_68_16]|nr:MAG: hypothetical protein BRD17_08375 [Halobacteriales archaeon SW_7_68_16]
MTKGEFDKFDLFWSFAYLMAGAVVVDIASVELFGVALSDTAFSLVGTAFSLASVTSAVIFALVYLTNDGSVRTMSDEYQAAVVATAVLIVGIPTIPQLESFVTSADLWALSTVLTQAAGLAAVSYWA